MRKHHPREKVAVIRGCNLDTNKKQDQIIDRFANADGWFDIYQRIIGFSTDLPPLEEKHKTDANLIDGCQSRLWLGAEKRDGKLVFFAHSDAKIMRGILALILRVINHQSPETIIETELYFLESIGLVSHLSPSRANGLAAILKRINKLAKSKK